MQYKKLLLSIFLSAVGIVVAFILFSNLYILSFEKGNIFSSIEAVPSAPTALVFGGGMKKDGITMSEMQTDRVVQAIALYKAGKVEKILVTGDDGANNSNEVDAMHNFAVAQGVPDEAVDKDPHGYNTYKSCDRAVHVFGVQKAIVISQHFHLGRILYFCSGQGMEAIGLSADIRDYGMWGKIWPQGGREVMARVKAVVSSKVDAVGNYVVY